MDQNRRLFAVCETLGCRRHNLHYFRRKDETPYCFKCGKRMVCLDVPYRPFAFVGLLERTLLIALCLGVVLAATVVILFSTSDGYRWLQFLVGVLLIAAAYAVTYVELERLVYANTFWQTKVPMSLPPEDRGQNVVRQFLGGLLVALLAAATVALHITPA